MSPSRHQNLNYILPQEPHETSINFSSVYISLGRNYVVKGEKGGSICTSFARSQRYR